MEICHLNIPLIFAGLNDIRVFIRAWAYTVFVFQQVRAIVEERATGGTGLRSFLQALEKIQANVRWRNDNEAKVSRWLQQLLHTELWDRARESEGS